MTLNAILAVYVVFLFYFYFCTFLLILLVETWFGSESIRKLSTPIEGVLANTCLSHNNDYFVIGQLITMGNHRLSTLLLLCFISLSLTLSVSADVPERRMEIAIAGNQMKLLCPEECTDGSAVWNRKVRDDSDWMTVFRHVNCTLPIENVNISLHGGIYTCTPRNSKLKWRQQLINVVILENAPHCSVEVKNVEDVVEGDTLRVVYYFLYYRNITGQLKFQRVCHVDGKELDYISGQSDYGAFGLPVTAEGIGKNITCTFHLSYESTYDGWVPAGVAPLTASCSAPHIDVKYGPRKIAIVSTARGGFKCSAYGNPAPTYQWLNNREVLANGSQFYPPLKDARYECHATNVFRNQNHHITAFVPESSVCVKCSRMLMAGCICLIRIFLY